MTAQCRRSRVRRRRLVAGAAMAVVVAAAIAWWTGRSPIVIPDHPCASPPAMRTAGGVTLQPAALAAFRAAEGQVGESIPVVWSYRSCQQQRVACRNICGDPQGCPDLCAPPGISWHQLGAAIDTTADALADGRIVRALLDNGWCQPLPRTDPGHFSFGGCH